MADIDFDATTVLVAYGNYCELGLFNVEVTSLDATSTTELHVGLDITMPNPGLEIVDRPLAGLAVAGTHWTTATGSADLTCDTGD